MPTSPIKRAFDLWQLNRWMTVADSPPKGNQAMRYGKDCACLDESPSEEVISQRSRVRRFTIWPIEHGQSHHGRTVMHRTFNSGDGSATLPGVTTFKKWRRPLYSRGETMYNLSVSSLTTKRKWRKDLFPNRETSCASHPLGMEEWTLGLKRMVLRFFNLICTRHRVRANARRLVLIHWRGCIRMCAMLVRLLR